jgi:hypothetical protein
MIRPKSLPNLFRRRLPGLVRFAEPVAIKEARCLSAIIGSKISSFEVNVASTMRRMPMSEVIGPPVDCRPPKREAAIILEEQRRPFG